MCVRGNTDQGAVTETFATTNTSTTSSSISPNTSLEIHNAVSPSCPSAESTFMRTRLCAHTRPSTMPTSSRSLSSYLVVQKYSRATSIHLQLAPSLQFRPNNTLPVRLDCLRRSPSRVFTRVTSHRKSRQRRHQAQLKSNRVLHRLSLPHQRPIRKCNVYLHQVNQNLLQFDLHLQAL